MRRDSQTMAKKRKSGSARPSVDRNKAAERKSKKQKAPELAHDDREIDVGTVVRYSAILFLATGVVLAVMWPIAMDWSAEEKAKYEAAPPVASNRPVFPDKPRLQRLPREGLAALREREQNELNSYAWRDKETRVARIPIDVAIEVLAKGQLEARRQKAPDPDKAVVPNEASLDDRPREEVNKP